MNVNELLIFKERKNREENRGPEAANKATAQAQKAPAEAKKDALEELKAKIAQHEEKVRKENAEKAAMRVAREAENKEGMRRVEPSFELRQTKQKKETKTEIIARKGAAGLSCIWHPWRPAYAICNYCHRAFCFEDIIDEGGNYYCLEDMDRVIRANVERASDKAASVSVIAGSAFLVPVLIFIYTYNTALASAVSYVAAIGFIPFIYNPIYTYAFPILGAIATMLSFILGIWLFLGNRDVFPGIAVGSLTAAMFLYNYTQSNSIPDIAIGLTSLAALMLFAYARSVYIPVREEVIVPREEEIAPQWTNVGKF